MALVITAGSVSLVPEFVAKFNSWDVAMDGGTYDSSGFEDLGWGDSVNTVITFSGSASGIAKYDVATSTPILAAVMAATASPASCEGAITLTATTGCTYSFTGLISSVTFTRPYRGVLELSFSFTSKGQVTQTWDESP